MTQINMGTVKCTNMAIIPYKKGVLQSFMCPLKKPQGTLSRTDGINTFKNISEAEEAGWQESNDLKYSQYGEYTMICPSCNKRNNKIEELA